MEEEAKQPIFRDLEADKGPEATAVESLCVECEEMGTTRFLMTRIPFFKEIILSSFDCPHCGYKNNFIQSAGAIQDKGCEVILKVTSKEDLNRQVVKQDSASVRVPELDFEVPMFSQKGELNTIEGILSRAVQGLEREQPLRKALDPDTANKIEEFIGKMKECIEGEKSFTFVIDDPSGNSFIENPLAPKADPNLATKEYTRTAEQNLKLNIQPEKQEQTKKEADEKKPEELKDEVQIFQTNCNSCQAPTETRMKFVSIPHFKEVIIMATVCDACGNRTNEVKSGTGVDAMGTRLTLKITDEIDLSRDVLKSETCVVTIPEIDFSVEAGTLGGRFTTLEGLLTNIYDHLKSVNPFGLGDSPGLGRENLKSFLASLQEIISGERMNVHIILDDPAGNSYIQNVYAPDPDPELKVEQYERTEEQNEDLGLVGMKTEGYEKDEQGS
ncbi:zinc finger protein ZPR1 [Nematostella vectensis]|uniref:zinc finger protein ZPR1 n=1 Tax=Nematostella vectensis TaxID=45351 RepID=UPI002076DAF8|nr:zinc finger protein ZPR1 [Nematostella vectensis]